MRALLCQAMVLDRQISMLGRVPPKGICQAKREIDCSAAVMWRHMLVLWASSVRQDGN